MADEHKVCEVPDCPGYGTAHPPIELADAPRVTWTVEIVTVRSADSIPQPTLDDLATALEDVLIGQTVTHFYDGEDRFTAIDSITVNHGRPT